MASKPDTAAGRLGSRTACSRHRRRRGVRRYDATGSSRPVPLRMDLWTKSRLRISSASSDGRPSTMVDHEEAIRDFLSHVDHETGYIE